MRRTRVLIADAVPIFRAGVRNLLLRESDFEVLEAGSFGEIEALASDGCPEIALIDLELPPSGGIAAASWLADRGATKTIVWSFAPSCDSVFEAIRAGADGYLHKEISSRGLVRALRGMTAGEAPIARDLATLMIDALHTLEARVSARERAADLSAREREVLELVATGAPNKAIASQLAISEFTVKRHMHNILHKLDLPSRRAAAGFYETAYGANEPALVGERV